MSLPAEEIGYVLFLVHIQLLADGCFPLINRAHTLLGDYADFFR